MSEKTTMPAAKEQPNHRSVEPQNQQHNVKKEALGPNIRRK